MASSACTLGTPEAAILTASIAFVIKSLASFSASFSDVLASSMGSSPAPFLFFSCPLSFARRGASSFPFAEDVFFGEPSSLSSFSSDLLFSSSLSLPSSASASSSSSSSFFSVSSSSSFSVFSSSSAKPNSLAFSAMTSSASMRSSSIMSAPAFGKSLASAFSSAVFASGKPSSSQLRHPLMARSTFSCAAVSLSTPLKSSCSSSSSGSASSPCSSWSSAGSSSSSSSSVFFSVFFVLSVAACAKVEGGKNPWSLDFASSTLPASSCNSASNSPDFGKCSLRAASSVSKASWMPSASLFLSPLTARKTLSAAIWLACSFSSSLIAASFFAASASSSKDVAETLSSASQSD
mmetsp:Transcript_22369/g.40278  ORF Transcript_22369/g.40278 Transcript_22369/m.40278 type:complete len:350 (-) Transcript_22369:1574-2623(-)